MSERERAVDLRGAVRVKTLPIAVALVALFALSAPTAFYLVRVDELKTHALRVAGEMTTMLREDAVLRPELWKYDSIKVLEHSRTFRNDSSIVAIDAVDADDTPLGGGRIESLDGVVWEQAPIMVGGKRVGAVWVAATLRHARRQALLLVIPFLLLGLAVSRLLYRAPLQALAEAEQQIGSLIHNLEGSKATLADANRSLEARVAERVGELRQAHEQLQERDARLRQLSARFAGAQEQERRAISRELHDAVGQSLTALRINVQLLAETRTDDAAFATLHSSTLALADDAMEELRRAVEMLGPSIFDEVGLEEAVQRLAVDTGERTGLDIECLFGTDVPELDAAVEVACYRVIQEALTNVVRHADATKVTLEVSTSERALRVSVRDDGQGAEDSAPTQRGGMGIVGMRERVELLGGRLEIGASDGTGMAVRAEIPFAHDREQARG